MRSFFVLAPILFLTGCATLFNSGSQTMQALGTDPDAKVKVNVTTPSGTYSTNLPATIVAEPSTFRDVKVEVAEKCYEPSQVIAQKGITPSFWANLLNFYGFIIDPLTGAMWKYDNRLQVPTVKKADCAAEVPKPFNPS